MYVSENLSQNQISRPNLPTVKCKCGYEILLIPDIKAMSRAIENHLQDHEQKQTNQIKHGKEIEKLRDALIVHVLAQAKKIQQPSTV